MNYDIFKAKIKQCADLLHYRLPDSEIDFLWERMSTWPDKQISDIIQNVVDDEKKFPTWNTWRRYRSQYVGTDRPDPIGRQKFYHVNDCPLCGYGAAAEWDNKFDRFTEYVHVRCSMPERENREQFLKRYKPPAPLDVYPASNREEMRPVFGNAAVSDDGKMHRPVQATEAVEVELPF